MKFQWINEGQIKKEGSRIEIWAPAQSDFFCNNDAISEEGITPETLCNAPFYYTEMAGDFVMEVRVSHDFDDTYDIFIVPYFQALRITVLIYYSLFRPCVI